jgi:ribosome recycling factor
LTQLNEERQNQQTSINEQRRYTDVEVQSSINQLNIDISPEILEQVENIRKIILELPTLTSEQKENLCQSVKNMETYCNNTKLLFEKYQHS